jgi:hypothetical protein
MATSNRQRVAEALAFVAVGLGAYAEDMMRQYLCNHWPAKAMADDACRKIGGHT